MSTWQMLLWALVGIGAAIPAAGALYLILSLAWIAKGEPDARCDAERDSGEFEPAERFIPCEIVCCRCGRHISGLGTQPNGRPTRKVSDLCAVCVELALDRTTNGNMAGELFCKEVSRA